MELSPGHDRAILQERSKGALRAYHLEDVDMWATKNSLLLSMESWLVIGILKNGLWNNPYINLYKLGSTIPYITQPTKVFFIAHVFLLEEC